MILGIDHIGINTVNINLYENILFKNNYKCLFKDEIFNNENKKIFLNKYSRYHKIAYYESLNNYFPIELTEHGNDISHKETPIAFEKNTISIKVEDIYQEKSIWSKLLGSENHKGDNISFNSILPKRNFHLEFIPVKKNIPYSLDTEGCTCIALLTKDVFESINLMDSISSCKILPPWRSEVNNKNLTIVMFKTVNGIIIELIQIDRKF